MFAVQTQQTQHTHTAAPAITETPFPRRKQFFGQLTFVYFPARMGEQIWQQGAEF